MDYPKPIKNIDELPERYGGIERERFWQSYWAACGVYDYLPLRPDGTPRSREEIYSVDTPPPTVSGALHIGHVYSYTQTDFSVRYQRMRGKHVFYPFGFDDNGLPSERLVERTTGKRAFEVGREAFIELCRPVIEGAEKEFVDLWQSLALSCDWSQFYTTIDARSRAISQASFIDLYNRGYVYRKEAPTMWCWADQTAIAQAEIEDKEVAGKFHDIVFRWADGPGQSARGELIIATTRPELIPACVAVFAHPDDERYRELFGMVAITPLFEVEVPILPSTKADPEKGTGILMCCTFGDMDDVEHWEQFSLPTRVIIERSGMISDFHERYVAGDTVGCQPMALTYARSEQSRLTAHWPARDAERAAAIATGMAGRKIKAAQEWIRGELDSAGLLRGVREITHVVRHSERGGVPIEILLTPQWYIKLLEYKEQLIEQGRKVKWHPAHMLKRFEHWVEGLNQDWCISRQRYNGVPFPVWYGADGHVVLAQLSQLPVNPLVDMPVLGGAGVPARESDGGQGRPPHQLTPEPDVMDTWATSSVTPLLNTHLVIGLDDADVAARHAQIFPYDLRPQAHDIIRTWAFYTITKAFYHFGVIPWQEIVISGHAQDAGGKKISKSKGHVVTPAQMVEKYTADGLRYWSSGCKLGTDTLYDEKLLGDGKRLVTKLFNATKFALRHLLDFDPTMVGRATFPVGRASLPAVKSLPEDFHTYHHRLPHWQLSGATYFVTWRLQQAHVRLDEKAREEVASALKHFNGERYTLLAYVVMDDHVHVLVQPFEGFKLEDIVHSWKSFTANRIQRAVGLQGSIWQDEYFDRVVRDEDELLEKAQYILNNPAKRWPDFSNYPYAWWWGLSCGTAGINGGQGRPPHQEESAPTRFDPQALLDLVVYPTDRWMLKRLQIAEERATKAHDDYEFSDAKLAAEEFFWGDFCDNYLELSKGRLYGEPLALDAHGPGSAHPYTPEQLRQSAQAALFTALGVVLRMFAPFLPHVCEECWSWYHAQWFTGRSIHEAPWPSYGYHVADEGDVQAGQLLLDMIAGARKWKSERNVSVKKPVARLTVHRTEQWPKDAAPELAQAVMGDLLATANAARAELSDAPAPADAALVENSPVAVVCELAEEA